MPAIKMLGTFKLTANLLRVTDPCYSKDTHCSGTIPALPGNWKAAVVYRDERDWGTRVKELLVWHTEKGSQELAQGATEDSEIDVGVDSGQAGFFDDDRYPDDPCDGEYEQQFYEIVCDLTLSDVQGGVIEFGVASSSGFGDGGYTCYVEKDKQGQVIAARIDYISDHDEDDFEDDCDLDPDVEEEDDE